MLCDEYRIFFRVQTKILRTSKHSSSALSAVGASKKKQSFNQISFVRVHVFLRFMRPKQHELLHGRAPSGDVEGLLH